MQVEVCANSLQSAINAEKAGADRIELCMELGVGGVTPSYGLLKSVKEQVSIPVHVLVRPRSGDFTYSDSEFQIMRRNIKLCVDLGFDGVVSGILTENFEIDVARTAILIEDSKGINFTFHRAFDWVEDAKKALLQLEELKVDYILTSGQQKTAVLGVVFLRELKNIAKHCVIMPGGGINADNAKVFIEKSFMYVHLSGVEIKRREIFSTKISMYSASFLKDNIIMETSFKAIKAMVSSVK
ncbi:copper homeostasis protein CutC [Maribacter sp.]|uniref:copper homeostasis protein CutC n=1 Tax=Maribacter sp. TaxID=1897614 RepID=UPI0025BD303A|nr:copper homeostasis protein CutC [Maribacter sp.]